MAEPIGPLNWQIFENTPTDCIDEIQLFLIGLLTEITREKLFFIDENRFVSTFFVGGNDESHLMNCERRAPTLF